jgi:nucleoside phosphorylase/CheY-like chemotaxis protein
MKILIVDDNGEKVTRVLEAIRDVTTFATEDIVVVYNARDARLQMSKLSFDLLILDVALPEWADVPANPEVGLALLKEISERKRYLLPKHIIGLTAYEDAFEQAVPTFEGELWHVIRYDPTASDWVEQIQRKIKYLVLAASNKEAIEYGCDLCIITALQIPEHRAVMELPWDWKLVELPNEVVNFYSGSFKNRGVTRKAIAACTNRMGMTSAAILSTKAIYNFRPRLLAMTGIAAGFRKECNLGDVIVGDPVWDYGSGKWAAKGSDSVFEIAPHQIPLNPSIRRRFDLLAGDSQLFNGIRDRWLGSKPDSALRIIIGPSASGSAVRADGSAVEEVKSQHRKTVAIEMEAYGVMSAAHQSPVPETKGFVVKAVCDFADQSKSDDFQAYAAYTSTSVVRAFAENHLPEI